MSDDDEQQPIQEASDDSRRTFLKVGVGAVGAGVACISAAPAVGYVLFPLDAQVTSGGEEFVVVGKRSMFGTETPVKVDVYANVKDAWNRQNDVRLGSCWVIERDGQLVALSTTCPHLGCAIDFDAEATKFKCPCHRSTFSVEGHREGGPSPRDMDELSIKDEDGLVMVMYQRFKQGVEDKEPA